MTIDIIYIATGNYIEFFTEYYDSAELNFIPEAKKTYFVFTDKDHPYLKKHNVIHIPQHQEYWPHAVLHKFHFVLETQHLLNGNFIIVSNANLIFINKITAKEFLPNKEDNWLLGVKHPIHNNLPPEKMPFENRKESKAFVPINKRKIYFQSALFGGGKKEFLNLCFILRNQVEQDYINNIVAVWHDESHLNSYFYNYKFPKILSPSYLYPEGYQIPYKPKILMLDKSKKSDKTFSYYRKYEWKEKSNKSILKKIIKKLK